MSSDGSVSSRMSQFGLYRTIDARTEEFLKLSKRRQIKQGCVCAAISTALTVTVVVTLLLIYEYNVINEARKSSHKTNWLGLMNTTANDPNLIEILHKEKIEIDKTTLKLLPILLKTLNQNRYIEKIIEEPTSLFTSYDKDVTTKASITTNIFSDTRNWMKTPRSRLYTIEYKTSPIVYFKNPTRNTDYFTKIRKIRDYQRILNYVDKMISDKNSFGTTQPIKRDFVRTEKPYKITTPIQKHKPTRNVTTKPNTSVKTLTEDNISNCKCTQNFSEVINKLFSAIQQILPYFSTTNKNEAIKCKHSISIQTEPIKSLNRPLINKNIHKMTTRKHNVFEPEISRNSSNQTFLNRNKYTVDNSKKDFDVRKDLNVNAIINVIKPSFYKDNIDVNLESNEVFSTTNSYVTSSQANDLLKESISKPYSKLPLNTLTNTKTSTDPGTIVPAYILPKESYYISQGIILPPTILPEVVFNKNYDYGDRTETTTSSTSNINRHSTRSMVTVKSYLTSKIKTISNGDKSNSFKGSKISLPVSKGIASLRKMGNSVLENQVNSLFVPTLHRSSAIFKEPKTTHLQSNKINILHNTKTTEKITTIKNRSNTEYINLRYINCKKNHTKNVTTEEKLEKVLNNVSTETSLKHMKEAITITNNETTINRVENYERIVPDLHQWEMVRLEEKSISAKSMIPLGRSTYLEMQRSNWKTDENHDFDTDINYIFD